MNQRAFQFFQRGGRRRQQVGELLHAVSWARRHARDQYAVDELGRLAPWVAPGSVVLDIGAHAGSWTVPLARSVGNEGLVIGYEALPHYGRSLRSCLRLLRVRNALVRTVAVGETGGEVALRWQTDQGDALTGRTHVDPSSTGATTGTIIVPMVRLDDDLRAHGIDFASVGFIKIDVEGGELPVLRGGTALLEAAHPAVYLEAEPQWTRRNGYTVDDIFAEMDKHGYRPHVVTESGIEETTLHGYMQTSNVNNVLFLHRSRQEAAAS